MDDEERLRMAESGIDSEDYRRFLEQPSGNYDDSGYFSVQVISSALEVWGLELIPYNSTEPRALEAQQCPEAMQAYICNYRDHWFTIRRLGQQWFNLNSLLTGPELISDTYLAMFLAQLQQEGYSIFVVFGLFPECEADALLKLVPAVQSVKPQFLGLVKGQNASSMASNHDRSSEEDLQRALKLSLGSHENQKEEEPEQDTSLQVPISPSTRNAGTKSNESTDNRDDVDLQKALRLSLKGHGQVSSSVPLKSTNDDEETELKQALRLSLQGASPVSEHEDLDLEKALKMSLECCDPPSSCEGCEANSYGSCDPRSSSEVVIESRNATSCVDAEDVRRKRLAYLEANARRNTSATTSSGGNTKSPVNT
ncbi:ataxin-3-like isoform X2 [Zootermopsis nevadensis]|nr:ataxin-3-like isoform X2 [Zootermopsis nevadensis]